MFFIFGPVDRALTNMIIPACYLPAVLENAKIEAGCNDMRLLILVVFSALAGLLICGVAWWKIRPRF
jgi:hypothetical protein